MSNILKGKLNTQVTNFNALKRGFFSERLYVFSFMLYLAANFINMTMFGHSNPLFWVLAPRLIELAGLLVAAKIFIFDGWKAEKLLIFTLLGIIFWEICKSSGEFYYFYYYLFILGAKNIRLERLLKVFLFTIAGLLLITIAASLTGLIINLSIGRHMEATVRYALGTIYPTDLAARVFYLLLAYVMLKRFHFSLAEYVSWIAITVITYAVTDTRLDLALMVLVLLLVAFYKRVVQLLEYLGSKTVAAILGAFVFVNIILAYTFIPHNHFFEIANKLLSGRLTYGHVAFQNYNVPFFGQYVFQMGNGGLHETPFQYFYIDSSFIRVLMMEGFLAFVALGFLFYICYRRFFKVKAYPLVIGMALLILSSVIDQHLLELAFNVLFLGALADLTYWSHAEY
ncbi:hypothetical protein [Liquorilactobacillus oeni]|uniref:Polysaccharide polymerase n=1 Tax=Liquorilactobacillus oeni DSM 19972 TaxID=1423777 RepID=A0A0R1MK98_9LACO|nr:hypothetical protein [Liquorilactobacillus oeni]KRL05746.1 hypothetical protein FD46_GL000497 [Liquorilactobacillus oeni DSM 19972]